MASSTSHDPAINGEKGPSAEQPVTMSAVDSGEGGSEPHPHVHLKTWLAVFAICLIYFAQCFAIVGAGSQGVIIATHFGRPKDAVWTAAPITIFTVVLGPIIAQAADYWGRKPFLIVLSLIGAAGSVVVSRATSMNMVIAGFNLVGIAFGTQPLLNAVPSEILPRRWRVWAQSFSMMSNAISVILSLISAGLLNRGGRDGWRIFYLIVMALFTLAVIICVFAYRPLPRKEQTMYNFREKMARLDWIGYMLLASSLVLFCMGLSWSQNPYEWSDPHPSAPFAIGMALFIVLVLYETKFKSDGMFNHDLFKHRNFAICLICISSEGLSYFAANIYLLFEVHVLWEPDTLLVNLRFVVAFATTIAASIFVGWYCALTKTIRWPTVSAFVVFIIYFILMATATRDMEQQIWGYSVLLGWSLGVTLITVVAAAQLVIPPDLIAVATGLLISVRSLGGTIGIAVYNAIFISTTDDMGEKVAKAALDAGLSSESVGEFVGALMTNNGTYLAQVPPNIIGAGTDALLDAYLLGFRNVWIAAAVFMTLATIASFFLIDPKKEFNYRIDAPVEKDEELYSS